MGARVACRTAEAARAVAVLCLAFPLEPPRRAGKPPQSRLSELEAVTVPTLVVQGVRDRFGMPPPGPGREVVKGQGDHGLKADLEAVAAAIRAWLPRWLSRRCTTVRTAEPASISAVRSNPGSGMGPVAQLVFKTGAVV